MTHLPARRLSVPTLFLCAVLAAATVLFAAPRANAAATDLHFNLGTLPVSYDRMSAFSIYGEFVNTAKDYWGMPLPPNTPESATPRWVSASKVTVTNAHYEYNHTDGMVHVSKPQHYTQTALSQTFSMSYAFSLEKDYQFTVFTNAHSTDIRNMNPFGRSYDLHMTLTDANGNSYRTGWFGDGSFKRHSTFSEGLTKGDYVLTISVFGAPQDPTLFNKGNLAFTVDFVTSDIPLPGALVLLGTAITGAGVWGRRRTRKTRAAAA
ncbi:hypothetical protein IHV25_09105 [Phaeovibrio sulfidiphilus]|uniref:PEP-CTERM protein-sorting domain-containing protein n=1 Tax=Phaeovibrio sulfidiphilus TaxID=1220600 RepID=A0A8J7CDJ5_9PROT|nr:hypothetical protein [Phaeovibrio sulfidiphilus]MBE1237803.1 hypothetical protein [Phaeovibrio sulfidiphilus]